MRDSIHPAYPASKVHCACGATWETRSTNVDLALDICSQCHPFFTGKQKLMDTAGRIDRFNKKYANLTTKPGEKPAAPPKPEPKAAKASDKPAKEKKPKAEKKAGEGKPEKAEKEPAAKA